MRVFRPITFVLLGLALLLAGFAYLVVMVSVPYPDPTPEMQAQERFHHTVGDAMLAIGLSLAMIGCAWASMRWLVGRYSRKG